ncbi:MAG: bifunctional salicylyl-CoA 5-hydroxylase/oxidoreductase, partial [Cellvibrionaceae bacterium]|nr:bifunctional salicylyl-CoA 5-hydroxylase/oxidoreductase [Cellvibrionaceae bacterium]
MKITVIGGGPGGMYFALLTKKAKPDWDIEIYEQNKRDDTFGFGVVFSDDTLDEFLSRDPESYERIRDDFAYWDDIVIRYKGEEIRASGNGFCGTSRVSLLNLLQARCRELDIPMHFEARIHPSEYETRFADSDIILASDGIGSATREYFSEGFNPSVVTKANRFVWMGSERPLKDFTYFFKETEHGLICAHTYQYEPGRSTWIFEMSDECWQGFAFEEQNEADSKAKLEKIFADELE